MSYMWPTFTPLTFTANSTPPDTLSSKSQPCITLAHSNLSPLVSEELYTSPCHGDDDIAWSTRQAINSLALTAAPLPGTPTTKHLVHTPTPACTTWKVLSYADGRASKAGKVRPLGGTTTSFRAAVRSGPRLLLFFPGNAGSAGQLRSIGSSYIAARSGSTSESLYGGPLLALDFGEAFFISSGRLVRDAAAWGVRLVHAAVRERDVAQQGDSEACLAPLDLLLVGHSMGGVVATLVLSAIQPLIAAGVVRVPLSLFLASPLVAPPVLLDAELATVYRDLQAGPPPLHPSFHMSPSLAARVAAAATNVQPRDAPLAPLVSTSLVYGDTTVVSLCGGGCLSPSHAADLADGATRQRDGGDDDDDD
eukprot:CAMPEP_0170751264 /NCGR_PEP_ID=MMETSP0437-20130122/11362_1 /TAXON_ID=0 /ORGANISM="Sexangularia sp." /LENGTH=363 /DNA_ID=CAMNT_0011090295 /DNA_START=110 /DNA_END=1198 /DNA_ORIENTATION=+